MNPDMLERLAAQYRMLAERLAAYPVRTVDTDESHGPKNSSFAIATDLLDCFSTKLGGTP